MHQPNIGKSGKTNLRKEYDKNKKIENGSVK